MEPDPSPPASPVETFPVGHVVVSGGPTSRWLGRWGIALGAAIPLAFWTWLVVFHPHGGPPSDAEFLALFATSWLGPAAALASRLIGRRRSRGGELRVSADRITVVAEDGSERSWPRADVVSGIDVGGNRIALGLRDGRRVEIDILGRTAGGALEVLGLGATERRVVFRWRRAFDAVLGGGVGMAFLGALFLVVPSPALGALVCPILAGLPWLFAGWLGATLSERSVEIGADGLRAKTRTRTVLTRFADLERVELVKGPFGGRLDLVMKDGRRERILLDPEDDKVRDAVLARIEEARAAAASRPEGQRLAELLRRAGSSFDELRATAARLLEASVGFRDASVSESEVAALLDDPVASAEQRIAAAIALAASKESGKARVRVAAEACASPKLRVALDAAAEGKLDDVMLAEAEEEAGSGARRAATRST